MTNAHEDILRSATAALAKGDMDTFLAAHTPDVKFHVAGSSPISGDYEGRDGVGGAFGKMMGILDAPPTVDLHDCLANDEHGILLVTQHMTRGGQARDFPSTLIFHFRDGLVSEVWWSPVDVAALEDFLA